MSNGPVYFKPPAVALFLAFDSLLEPRSAIYAAGPLETGKEYFMRLSEGGGVANDYRAKNQSHLTAFARHLRQTKHPIVLDPGILRCADWTGDDYGAFFIELLTRYAFAAWFLDDWHYSFGTTREFVTCQVKGIPCYDERGILIDKAHGVRLIAESCEFIGSLGLDNARMRSRLSTLRERD